MIDRVSLHACSDRRQQEQGLHLGGHRLTAFGCDIDVQAMTINKASRLPML